MEALLCRAMGLPQDIVCDILDDAEYWIRISDTGGESGETTYHCVTYAAKVQIPKSARLHKPVRRIVLITDAHLGKCGSSGV